MRPDRGIVKKAIEDAEGNLTKAAILLGCTRQTLYTWIYQLSLERLAGIRMDKRAELDARDRLDNLGGKRQATGKSGVYSGPSGSPTLRVVETMVADADHVQASMKMPVDLWRRAKIEAIREGCTVSDYVKRLLIEKLGTAEVPQRKVARNGRDKGGASE